MDGPACGRYDIVRAASLDPFRSSHRAACCHPSVHPFPTHRLPRTACRPAATSYAPAIHLEWPRSFRPRPGRSSGGAGVPRKADSPTPVRGSSRRRSCCRQVATAVISCSANRYASCNRSALLASGLLTRAGSAPRVPPPGSFVLESSCSTPLSVHRKSAVAEAATGERRPARPTPPGAPSIRRSRRERMPQNAVVMR